MKSKYNFLMLFTFVTIVLLNVFIFCHIIEIDASSPKTLSANDCSLHYSQDNSSIYPYDISSCMNIEAYDVDGSDITSKVKIYDTDGFDIDDPTVGTFDIKISIEYSDGDVSDIDRELTVSAEDAQLVGSGLLLHYNQRPTTEEDLIDMMTSSAIDADMTDISSEVKIESLNGFKYNKLEDGNYEIDISVTGMNNNTIYETANIAVVPGDDVIVGSDTSTIQYLAPKNEDDLLDILSIEALDYIGDNLDENLIIDSIDNYDYANPKVGEYEIEVSTILDCSLSWVVLPSIFCKDSANETYTLEVIENQPAKLNSSNYTIGLKNAPQSEKELFMQMNVEATDYDGKDIIKDVEIDSGGYDIHAPSTGTYEITLSVRGASNQLVSTTSKLYIVEQSNDILTYDAASNSYYVDEAGNVYFNGHIVATGINNYIYLFLAIITMIIILVTIKKYIKW